MKCWHSVVNWETLSCIKNDKQLKLLKNLNNRKVWNKLIFWENTQKMLTHIYSQPGIEMKAESR